MATDRTLKRILAIDSATSCGWAHDPPEDLRAAGMRGIAMNRAHLPISGTWNLEGWRPDVVDQSYATLFNNIVQAISANKIDVVVIERPLSVYAHSGFEPGKTWKGAGRKDPDLAEALLGFVAVAQCAARRMGCKPYVVAPSTVRAHFCGNGRPADPKAAVMTRCRQLGWAFVDHNSADALATWDYAKSVLSPGWAWQSTPMGANA